MILGSAMYPFLLRVSVTTLLRAVTLRPLAGLLVRITDGLQSSVCVTVMCRWSCCLH